MRIYPNQRKCCLKQILKLGSKASGILIKIETKSEDGVSGSLYRMDLKSDIEGNFSLFWLQPIDNNVRKSKFRIIINWERIMKNFWMRRREIKAQSIASGDKRTTGHTNFAYEGYNSQNKNWKGWRYTVWCGVTITRSVAIQSNIRECE